MKKSSNKSPVYTKLAPNISTKRNQGSISQQPTPELQVIKRKGQLENVSFDKITSRIRALSDGLNVNPTLVAQKVIQGLKDRIKTSELDELAASICSDLVSLQPDYEKLAAKIIISNHQKNTEGMPFFSGVMDLLYHNTDANGNHAPLLNKPFYELTQDFADEYENMIDYDRDYFFTYFGFKTLAHGKYLMRLGDTIVERPQHLIMRVAVSLHKSDLRRVKETYELMSNLYFTHATPTLFNAGSPVNQLASCFLLSMKDDSIKGIFETLADTAAISKTAGGIGLAIHKIRADGSVIRSTNGRSTGLLKMLKVFNATANYVDQGGNKRNGSFAIYIEPWHADIFTFVKMRRPDGNSELRAQQLFYALWIPDLFMKRVKNNETWSLMCPDHCPGLSDCWGEEFEKLYTRYEHEGRFRRQVPAQQLWAEIIRTQQLTGQPYMLYKDQCNRVSPQQHLGTIPSSNLCVGPCTRVLTREGEQSIINLVGQEIEVWNGCSFSNVKVTKTGVDQPMLEIAFSNQKALTCTWYHKFYVIVVGSILKNFDLRNLLTEYLQRGLVKVVEAKDLNPGDRLIPWKLPNNAYYKDPVTVTAVNSVRHSDTYCFKEPKLGTAVFNGVLTGQCSEIVQKSSSTEQSVCNLLSISLPAFVEYKNGDRERPYFNYDNLEYVTKVAVRNLNHVIDQTYYPTSETRSTNLRDRPMGIGVQGLANAFIMMRYPFDSDEARQLNRNIFECMYYSAMHASMKLAKRDGGYDGYENSVLAKEGKLHCDYFDITLNEKRWNWNKLRQKIKKYGVRNSLLIALMPTASTSQILGNNEAFEPFTSNFYVRRTLSGDFIVANRYLIDDLNNLGLWNPQMRDKIIAENGSIQNISEIPDYLKDIYKIAWDIPQKVIIDLAADRQPFVDQSQSMNLFVAEPSVGKISSMHMYTWSKGLKTGMYYLRSKPGSEAEKVTVDPKLAKNKILTQTDPEPEPKLCSLLEGCVSCSG